MLGGRYRLVAPIGVGTSSRVFLAVDTQLRRRVAVKLLHEALAEDEAFLRRFRAEARAAGALNHPNIVAVFDWGEDHSDAGVVPYLVTEFLGGGSLREMLDRTPTLTPSQTLLVGLDAARALAHAHLRGLVHRDVKPGNLLFDDEGRLRLADFGLARALAEASWTEPTGTAVGTARYASPEQALGRRLDGRSDVYSLALVLVECLTGQVPFAADTTAATLALRTQGDLELGPELGGLRSVLERAGRLDPVERPEAAEFEIALMATAEEYERPEPLPIVATLGDGQETSEMLLVAGIGAITGLEDDQVDLTNGSTHRDPEVLPVPPPEVIGEESDEVPAAGSAELAGVAAGAAPAAGSDEAALDASASATVAGASGNGAVAAPPDRPTSNPATSNPAASNPAASSPAADRRHDGAPRPHHRRGGARAAQRLPPDVVRQGRALRSGPRPDRRRPHRTPAAQGRQGGGEGRTRRAEGLGPRSTTASALAPPGHGDRRGPGAARRRRRRLVVHDPRSGPRRPRLLGDDRRTGDRRGRPARLGGRRRHRRPTGRHITRRHPRADPRGRHRAGRGRDRHLHRLARRHAHHGARRRRDRRGRRPRRGRGTRLRHRDRHSRVRRGARGRHGRACHSRRREAPRSTTATSCHGAR